MSFLKALRHSLSKRYRYVIVSDRGFGNDRFSKACVENGFDYVVRMNENLRLVVEGKKCNLTDFVGTNFDINAEVAAWRESHRFVGCTKDKNAWILMTNLTKNEGAIVDFYRQRFGIEKGFQDQKSSGFDIEKSKIKEYDRFKRLLFCVYFAQALMIMVGEFIFARKITTIIKTTYLLLPVGCFFKEAAMHSSSL